MTCEEVQNSVSAFIDRQLPGEESVLVSLHVAGCRRCAHLAERHNYTRNIVRELANVQPPVRLAFKLRVLASHERRRRLSQISFAARVRTWSEEARLVINNLMKPLALPFAGGLLSALFLFGVLLPTFRFERDITNDVPTAFYTQASVAEMAPFGVNDAETIVELTIDQRGRITAYCVPNGQDSPQLDANIANMMWYSTFTPATWFGQPTLGKVLVSFRRSRIIVRG